ncbi:MAG: hypothetical protein LCI00_08245 [Chloroflexi bacterium]|nr:hypothetical protein [Chloroflexota bacterium]
MNTIEAITQTALNRYNRLFDNQQYTAIAERFVTDLRSNRDSVRVADAMNLVTDTALLLCQHPHYEQAWLKLATFCGQNAVPIATIDAIYTYLLIFQQAKDTRADDFEGTAKALLKTYETSDTLRAAVSCANGIHGWQGRMAYELLAGADYLMQSAIQLLIHGNPSYIREKLQFGLRRLTGALHEGIRESGTPAMFDFKGTYFPDEHDRR